MPPTSYTNSLAGGTLHPFKLEKELFEQYRDAQAGMEEITKYDTFTYALKFGVLFMTEIFMGKGEMVSKKENATMSKTLFTPIIK